MVCFGIASASTKTSGMQLYTYLQLLEWGYGETYAHDPSISAIFKNQIEGFQAGVASTLNVIAGFDRDSIKPYKSSRLCLPLRNLEDDDIHKAIMLVADSHDYGYGTMTDDIPSKIGYGQASAAVIAGLRRMFPC